MTEFCDKCFMTDPHCICSLNSVSPIDPLAKALEHLLQSDHPHVSESLILSDIIAMVLERLAKAARARATLTRFKENGIETND